MPSPHGAPTGALSVHRRTAGRRPSTAAPPLEPRLAPAWIGGVLAALQAALWSYLVVVVPAVAGFVSGAAAVTTNATWRSAVGVGSKIWLLGHGVPLEVSGATVSIVPLGVTAVAVICCTVSVRRSARTTVAARGAFVGAYAAITTLGALVTDGSWWRGLLGGCLVALVGVGWSSLRPREPRPRADRSRLLDRVPQVLRPSPAVRDGARCAAALVALLVVVAAVLVVVWSLAGRSVSEDIVESLGLDMTSGVVLALGQATLVPNLVLWAVAWVSGAGFVVGTGTSFAPGEAVMGPLPAVPMLGGLPTGDMAGAAGRWAPVVVVLLAAWLSVVLWRRLRARAGLDEVRAADLLGAAAAFVATTMLLGGLGGILSGGAAGPGRLATVGADGAAVAGRLGLLSAAACAVVLLVAHPAPRRAVRGALGQAWQAVAPGGRASD